jgi:hypothetical protein
MAKPLVTAKGLDGATAISLMLDICTTSEAGADWDGGLRVPNKGQKASNTPSNAELIEYLAEEGRDIRATSRENQHAAVLFSNELVKKMRRVGNIAQGNVKTVETQAAQGI